MLLCFFLEMVSEYIDTHMREQVVHTHCDFSFSTTENTVTMNLILQTDFYEILLYLLTFPPMSYLE